MFWKPKPANLESKGAVPTFLQLEKPYRIFLSREKGEVFLNKLAKESAREYAWTFDEDTEVWYYHPSERHTLHISEQDGAVKHELWLPKEYEIPQGDNCVDYHIHPVHGIYELLKNKDIDKDGWTEQTMTVNNQMPSGDDFKSCAERYKKGFKSSRIVTPEGVTTIHFHPEHAVGKITMDVNISRDLTIKLLQESSGNMAYTLQKHIEEVNRQLPKVFSLSFEPTPKV
jgi:hypothetical protein